MEKPTKRIVWSAQEWDQLVEAEPELMMHRDPYTLYTILCKAQRVLPQNRQRAAKYINNGCRMSRNAVLASIKAAAERLAELPQIPIAPNPAPAAQSTPTPTTRHVVFWTQREYNMLAHHSAVTPLLDKTARAKPRDLVNAVLAAQAAVLPWDRWRGSQQIYQSCVSPKKRNLVSQLRDAMRFPPIPTPPVQAQPVQARPEVVEPAAPAAPIEVPGVVAPNPLAAALAGLVEAMQQQLQQTVATSFDRVLEGVLVKTLHEALQKQDAHIEATVRRSVVELLGAPANEPSKPDFRADAAAEAAAEAAADAVVAKARGPRVDVVGLLNGQVDVVRRAVGDSFSLRFLTADEGLRQDLTAPIVIVVKKFVNHSIDARVKKAGATLVYANGGPESVLKILQTECARA